MGCVPDGWFVQTMPVCMLMLLGDTEPECRGWDET